MLLASACWGSSGLWIRWATIAGNLSPVGLAFWRDLVTFLCLLVAALGFAPGRAVRSLAVARKDVPWLAAMGVFSIGLFHVLWNKSVMMNGVAAATVLQYNAPMLVILAAWAFWREPLTWRKLGAVGLALPGTVLITGLDAAGMQITTSGLLVGLCTAAGFGAMSLFGKKLVGAYPSWLVLMYAFGFGALVLAFLHWWGGPPWGLPRPALLPFGILVLVPTLGGFGLYTLALSHLTASISAIVATAEIVFAALISVLILGERLHAGQWLGALLVVAGVILVSLPSRRQRRGGGS